MRSFPEVSGLSMMEAALAYARAGLPIFPLGSRNKHPIEHGGFHTATADESQIRAWWGQYPEANIGAVPGRIGCIVPDLDTPEAVEAWRRIVPVDTAEVRTGSGKGLHPWYRVSPELSGKTHWRSAEDGFLGEPALARLLFRASGGYVVVPPSIHPDTDRPYLLADASQEISSLPSDIEEALLGIAARNAGESKPIDSELAAQWIADHSKPMSEGGEEILKRTLDRIRSAPRDARNDTMLAEVGSLLNASYLWPIDIEEARQRVAEVYVPHVSDRRKATQAHREVDHAFAYVATQRYHEGPPPVELGGVPITREKVKLAAPVTRAEQVAALAEQGIGGRLRLGALVKGEIPETDWLVSGVIPRGRMTSIVADAKSGKSLLMLDIAAALATGTSIFGRAQDPMRVLYVDYEMTPEDTAMRLIAMGYGEDETTTRLLDENLVYLQTPSLDPLDTPEGGEVLLEIVLSEGCEVVIIDTAAASVSGAENDSDTWRAARQSTWTPLKAAGVTVARLDHFGKDPKAGARGSSFKRDDVDLEWRLSLAGGPVGHEQMRLTRGVSRLPAVEDSIDIVRKANPLRHVRIGTQSWQRNAVALAQEIQRKSLPFDTVPRLEAALKKAGVIYSRADLLPARRYLLAGAPPVDQHMRSVVEDPRAGEPAQSPSGAPEKAIEAPKAPIPTESPSSPEEAQRRRRRAPRLPGLPTIEEHEVT